MQFCVTLELLSVPRSVFTCTYRCDMGDFWLTKMEENQCNEVCTNTATQLKTEI